MSMPNSPETAKPSDRLDPARHEPRRIPRAPFGERRLRCLLVYPKFPPSYWGFEYVTAITGKPGTYPPNGLITVAGMLPRSWELRLVDLNIEALKDETLEWADVVMVGAMRVQRESFHEVVARSHAFGKIVVAGGPYVTTDPEAASDADHLVLGEAEGLMEGFCRDLERGTAARRVKAQERPDVSTTPIPRFDLLKPGAYLDISVQFSRGCPFNCEFCDIIEIYGRVPRLKTPEQMLAEFDAIHATGFRGSVFVVDDNFIGNKKAARAFLAKLAEWQRERGFPFTLYTEASVNLADDQALMDGMVDAGFAAVFLGIESPSEETLLATQKRQNVRTNVGAAVDAITRSGIEVMAGFIVGFDGDDETVFRRQREFISANPIPLAMVGILFALPGTQLWRRLEKEGRLYGDSVGDSAYRPNFATRLPEETLVAGYSRLLRELYAPRAYFDRCLLAIERLGGSRPKAGRKARLGEIPILLRSLFIQGVLRPYRREYWRFLAKALLTSWRRFPRAVALAVSAEHMIRYTFEHVLPRLERESADRIREPVRLAPEPLPSERPVNIRSR